MTGAIAILLRMAQNNAWANGRLYAALQGMDRAAFHAPRPGFFPSLKATLNHIHQVDLYYLDALENGGVGRAVYDAPEIDDIAPLRAAQAAADARLIAFCADLTPDALATPCTTDRPEGSVTETTGALVLHLIQHQIHHRGQAHVQVQAAEIAPPQLDDFHLDYGRHADAQRYFE
ncbi:MAG: DinB family protein [Pseudomonadota bacterium]